MRIRQVTNQDTQKVREITKQIGLKISVRKATSKFYIYVGRQTKQLKSAVAAELIEKLAAEGFRPDMPDVTAALIEKGIADMFMFCIPVK